jgi:hypothetical protein
MAIIQLTDGSSTVVDDADYEWLNRWTWQNNNGYAARSTSIRTGSGKKTIRLFMHRVLTDAPEGMTVDHINRDKLDNRRVNLRLASVAENQYNHSGCGSFSGMRGVSLEKRGMRWEAHIKSDGRRIYLGYFHTAFEAALAYDRAARAFAGPFAWLNLPPWTSEMDSLVPADQAVAVR